MDREQERKVLERGVSIALDRFYRNDSDLLWLGVREECLVGNFYRYFCEDVLNCFNDPELRIDVEYDRCCRNRDLKLGYSGRRIGNVRPDLVVHHRGNSDCNVCAFEFKRYDNPKSRETDFRKLRKYVKKLGYHFGCFIEFGLERKTCKIFWIGDVEGVDLAFDFEMESNCKGNLERMV